MDFSAYNCVAEVNNTINHTLHYNDFNNHLRMEAVTVQCAVTDCDEGHQVSSRKKKEIC